LREEYNSGDSNLNYPPTLNYYEEPTRHYKDGMLIPGTFFRSKEHESK